MKLLEISGGFELSFKGKVLIKHTALLPAIFSGKDQIDISMKNGDFKFVDRTVFSPVEYVGIENNIIKFSDFQISCELDQNGRLDLVFINLQKAMKINFEAEPEEKIFGMGEQFTELDLRGKIVRNWVEEHITRKQIYSKILRSALHFKMKKWKYEDYRTYFIMPTYISSDNYFVSVDTDGFAYCDFSNNNYHSLSFYSELKKITISKKQSMLEISADLCDFKGKMPKLPEWIYDGMIFAVQGGTEIVNEKLKKLEAGDVAVNGIWSQDWCGELFTFFGKQVFWNWEVDKKLYPNLQENILLWEKKGVKFFAYINPYLNEFGELFKEANNLGYLVESPEGGPFLTKATSFNFGIIDLTNINAYNWFKQLIKTNYLSLGIKGWMADFGEYLPSDCILKNGNAKDLHNVWPDLWAKLNREVIEEMNLISQAVFFNRAGYKDNTKYTTLIWNGDQHVDFSDDFGMASALRAALSLSMSGVGFSHSDVGGYTTVPYISRTKELYIRWLEMCAFTPVMRSHEGNKPWKNVQFDYDLETIELTAKFTNIHKKLKSYFLDVENQYHLKGYPMIRPLFFHYDVYTDAAFLLGQDLLVYPVVKKGCCEMKVEIPSNGWIHLFSKKTYDKGIHQVKCPLGEPAVFYKKESQFTSVFKTI